MGRFNNHRSHVPNASERNAAANRRAVEFSVGPFDVTLSPIETSVLRRDMRPIDRELGRKHATVNVSGEKVRAIEELKIQNPKTREAVARWKMYGPDPFQFIRLLSPTEARNEDLLWKLASDRLHVPTPHVPEEVD